MAGIAIDVAITTGHETWPPTQVHGTSSTVKVNGKSVILNGDPIVPHTQVVEPYQTHGGNVIASSKTVFIEGRAVARIGDPITCGDTIASSSNDVFCG